MRNAVSPSFKRTLKILKDLQQNARLMSSHSKGLNSRLLPTQAYLDDLIQAALKRNESVLRRYSKKLRSAVARGTYPAGKGFNPNDTLSKIDKAVNKELDGLMSKNYPVGYSWSSLSDGRPIRDLPYDLLRYPTNPVENAGGKTLQEHLANSIMEARLRSNAPLLSDLDISNIIK